MKFTNEWVSYLDRNFERVRSSLIARLKIKVPEITDFSVNHILIIMIEMFAGISEQINAYIDNWSRESFLSVARRFSSVLKHARAYDYHVQSRIPATVDLEFYFENPDGTTPNNNYDQTIPGGTLVTDGTHQFITTQTLVIPLGSTHGSVPAAQYEVETNKLVGRTNGLVSQIIELPEDVAEGSIQLEIDGEIYIFKDTLAKSTFLDKHFTTTLTANKHPVIVFGNGIQGAIPPAPKDVIATYNITLGVQANSIEPNTLTTISSQINIEGGLGDELKVTNPNAPSGGSDVESMESIRRNTVLSLRTLEYAVTESDHEDIAKLAPGVGDAVLRYTHPRYLEIYITAINGGIASAQLLQSTYQYIFTRRLLGRNIKVKAAGESDLILEITLATKFRHDPDENKNEVMLALLDAYSAANSRINRAIRYSDIISVIENQPSTDYVKVEKLNINPVPRGLGGNDKTLVTTKMEVLITSEERTQWRITYTGNRFVLYRGGFAQTSIHFDQEYTTRDNALTIQLPDGPYDTGDTWEFTTYPYNRDIEVNDYTMPVLAVNNLKITNLEKVI